MSTEELRSELVLREWDQAWVHSRHLEDLRRHYLGFFFTALLSVTAFAGYFARRHPSPSASLLTISALALGLQMLSMYLFLAVSRVNEVLDHYLNVVQRIRDQLPIDGSSPVDLGIYRHTPLPQREGRLGRLILWHGSEAVLGLAAGIFVLILAANFICALTLAGVSSTARSVSLAALLLSFVSCVFVFWLLHSSSRNQDRGEPSAL